MWYDTTCPRGPSAINIRNGNPCNTTRISRHREANVIGLNATAGGLVDGECCIRSTANLDVPFRHAQISVVVVKRVDSVDGTVLKQY